MKKLESKVNIIPVIAKADTITKAELQKFKAKIMSELTSNGVQIYNFPTDDESVAETNKTMNVGYLPSISTRVIFPSSYINLCQCLSGRLCIQTSVGSNQRL
jgi:hypothetical protein